MLLHTIGLPPTTKLPVWDFVLHREDGTAMRLHPQWSPLPGPDGKKKKARPEVEAFGLDGHAEPVAPPAAGFGRSDGRGTYRHFLTLGFEKKLKFDGAKLPH